MPVLVVDDDAGIREVIKDALAESGYEVFIARNGQEAVALARSRQPRVILMDLMMPVMDGAEAIRILKDDPETARIRIVAMSAGMNLQQQTGRLLLADGLLGKPFDLEVLLAQVDLRTQQFLRTEGSP